MSRLILGMLISLSLGATTPEFIWQHNGIPIHQAADIGWDRESTTTPDGDLLLTWVDSRDGGRKVYAQKVDADGNALWETGGIVVSPEVLLSQESPVIASDGFGGAFIAWLGRTTFDSVAVYAQHVEIDGNLTWNTGEILMDQWYVHDIKTRYNLKITSGLEHHTFLVWNAEHELGMDIYGTRLSWAGALAPRLIQSNVGFSDIAAIDSGAVIVWEDNSYHSLIAAQRIDRDLNPVWGPGGRVVCDSVSTQMNPRVTQAGSNRVAVAWLDSREGPGLKIYSQLLDGNGNPEWLVNGVPVADVQVSQEPFRLTADLSRIFFVWADGEQVVSQCLDYAGTQQWNSAGLLIASGQTTYYKLPQIVSDGTGGIFIVWGCRFLDSSISRIYCQHLTATGAISFPENGLPITSNQFSQFYPAVVADGVHGCFITWMGLDSTGSSIKSQRITAEGTTQWADGGLSHFTGNVTSAQRFRTLSWSNDQLHFFWNGGDHWSGNGALYAQTVNSSGAQDFETNGKYLWHSAGHDFDVVPDGNSGAYIGFESAVNGIRKLYLQKVNEFLEPTWPELGAYVNDQTFFDQKAPLLVRAADGYLYFIWSEVRNFIDEDVFVQKFDPDGNPQWAEGGVSIAPDQSGDDYAKAALAMADSGIVILWQSLPIYDNGELYLSKLNPDGTIAWRETITASPASQGNPQLLYDANLDRCYMAWEDSRNGNIDLYMKYGDSDGNLSEDIIITDNGTDEISLNLVMADDTSAAIWAGWSEEMTDSSGRRYGQICVRNMSDFSDPVQITDIQSIKENLQIEALSDNRFLAVWSEYRNQQQYGNDLYFYDAEGEGVYGQMNGVLLCNAPYNQVDCRIVPFLGSTPESMRYGIVWRDARGSFFGPEGAIFYYGIYAQTYSNDFTAVDAEPAQPITFSLGAAYPNPFNGAVTVPFSQPVSGKADLTVFDLLGRKVYSRTHNLHSQSTLLWEGMDNSGRSLQSGIYFLNVQVSGESFTQKVTYLK